MTLDKMTAKPSVYPQGALQIYRVPGFEVSEVGPVEAFGEQVEHKLALALGGYCEAAAIDRDALPNPHSCGRAGAFD
jgi:hypothetical protein